MSTQLVSSIVFDLAPGDLVTRLATNRRIRELNELAAAEGLRLPMPAAWIATLELAGYVVDLATGKWSTADDVRFAPTAEGRQLAAGGAA